MSDQCYMSFEKLGEDGRARRGRLTFPRGTVETPAFMPVGTYGTVKGMLPRDIKDIGAESMTLPSGKARSSPTPAASRCSAWARCAKSPKRASRSGRR